MTTRQALPELAGLFRLAVWIVSALLSATTPAAADWTASGRFNYTDRLYDLSGFTGTATAPVREADVEVYDINTSSVLATGATDPNGDFSVFVVDASTRDVGVRVLSSTDDTASLNFSVVDDGSGNATYSYHDATTDVSSHGSSSDVNFGTMTMPAAIGSVGTTDWSSQVFNAFDMMLLVADWIASVDGSRPSVAVTIGWNPTNGRGGSFYNSGSNRVSLSDDDAYDDPNILHEIGHYVDDEYSDSDNTGGSHFIGDDDQDPRLSWSEGVATFFSNASLELGGRPRPDIYCDRDSFGASGGGGFAYQLESAVSGGGTNEQAVNAALWNIIDTATSLDASPTTDDDPMSDSHANVWAVIEQLRVAAPANVQVEDFWELWFSLALGSQANMETVYAGHQMDFAADSQEPNEAPTTATVLTVGGGYQENSFYRSGSEAGGDEDWFRFAATSGSYYRIEVNGSANTIYGRPDPELFLLDANLEPLAYSDDPYDTSLNNQSSSTAQDMDETSPSILFQAAATGDHYAYLRHASYPLNLDGRYGTYQIRVQSVSSPTPNVDSVAAQRMLPGESYQALVIGSDFALGATVTLSDPGLTASGVDWISPTALVATIDVDAAVSNASYSLTVSNPGAGSDSISSAVEADSSSQPAVVLSEIEIGNPDKVEVRNLGTSSAVLTGWQIRSYRPGSTTSTFTFPTFTLSAGATVLVSESSGTDTATELFDPGSVVSWPWFNGRGGGVSLVDDGDRNVDYIRFVDSFVDEHEDPLGTGGRWMQPELVSPANGFTLSRAELSSLYSSRLGLSVANPTMPNGASGRDNAVDGWEDNDAPRRVRLFPIDETISDLEISSRPIGTDDDWFGFAVAAGDSVDFTITFSHSSGDLDMALYPPGEESVAILTATSVTDDETIALTGPLTTTHGAGVYRLLVYGASGATNSYNLAAAPSGGVCGDGVLDLGETCDDGNTTPGDCCSGSCQIEPNGTLCRLAVDLCDAPETCDGFADSCPADAFATIATECRPSAGDCDVAESCTGSEVECPVDEFMVAATECRASADLCDVAEVCTGSDAVCPADAFAIAATECRPSAGDCDVAES
ncbi:MAG: lamin tail domain-containing protein, partial [Myxococcota bacterium]